MLLLLDGLGLWVVRSRALVKTRLVVMKLNWGNNWCQAIVGALLESLFSSIS